MILIRLLILELLIARARHYSRLADASYADVEAFVAWIGRRRAH